MVKNPPAMQEMRVQSLGQEDPWRRKWQPTTLFFLDLFNWRIVTLQYCDGFCHTSVRIGHRQTCVPSTRNTPLPPHPILPGHLRALSSGSLCYTSNFHWPSVLHMVLSMLQCYSLKSSHPLLLPLSPKIFFLFLPGKFHGQRNWQATVHGVAKSQTRLSD